MSHTCGEAIEKKEKREKRRKREGRKEEKEEEKGRGCQGGSDKKRKTHRELYNNLKILIIDEISMVKADMLYQINLRLMELKQNDMIFGGVAVILFGDLLQLIDISLHDIYTDAFFDPQRNRRKK